LPQTIGEQLVQKLHSCSAQNFIKCATNTKWSGKNYQKLMEVVIGLTDRSVHASAVVVLTFASVK
jgi:hypothetical protein